MERDDKERLLDQYIDSALAKYGRAEPRPGIETRIIAGLRAEEARSVLTHRWKWMVLTACSALAISAFIAIHFNAGRSHKPVIAVQQTVGSHGVPRVGSEGSPHLGGQEAGLATPSRRVTRHRSAGTSEATELAKLNQFPSPAPLSEQEQILTRYVSEHRRQAVMLARAQTDLFDRERREEQGPKMSNPEKVADKTR
jgi:hypothetical protein